MANTTATLTFFERGSCPPDQNPYELLFKPEDDSFPTCNYKSTQVSGVPIYDLRLLRDTSLDREGFVVVSLDTKMEYQDYFDSEKLKAVYLPEIKNLLKQSLGIKAAYVHECVLRSSATKEDYEGTLGRPIPNIHTDYTHSYALKLIAELSGDNFEADQIRARRTQMLKFVVRPHGAYLLNMEAKVDSVWKPLRGPVRNWPLALCDLQSLQRSDIVTLEEVHATAVLESQQVMYNPAQKWYYVKDQKATEVTIFKSMDSIVRGEVAHGSFFNATNSDGEPPRQSVELRVLVVY